MTPTFIELPDCHGRPMLVERSRVAAIIASTDGKGSVVMFSGRSDDGISCGYSVHDAGLRLLEMPRVPVGFDGTTVEDL